MRIVSEVSLDIGRMYGPQFVSSGVTVTKSEEGGVTKYVVSGTAAKMSDEQLEVYRKEERDESVALSKPYYLLFGVVVESGEKVVISDEEGGRVYNVDNSGKRTSVKGGLLLNLGPANPAFRYTGTATGRDGATSDFEIVSGEIVLAG